jgi:hypothetical protein
MGDGELHADDAAEARSLGVCCLKALAGMPIAAMPTTRGYRGVSTSFPTY